MSQTVLKLSLNQINSMIREYAGSLADKTPPGAVFAAKAPGCSVTAYKSGKVLFQGTNHAAEAAKWGVSSATVKKDNQTKYVKPSQYAPPTGLYGVSHAGSDEAGTGDYFGPITVACAFVKENQIEQLRKIGVQDSKNLKDNRIRQIAKDIIALGIPYSLKVLHNPKYNDLQEKGWSQGKMKGMLHHYAINSLLEKIEGEKPRGIIIDQFAEPEVYKRYLLSESTTLQKNVFFLKKAESLSIAVAAGSIIARTAFVKHMDLLSNQLDMPIPKGASNLVDQAAANIINRYGEEKLYECAKVHFATTNKAKLLC